MVSSKDGHLNDETFVKSKYENKQNIICLFHREENYVIGGYSYSGWKSGKQVYNYDDKAFVFKIRTKEGYNPMIVNVKKERAKKAIYSYPKVYLIFGDNWFIDVDIRNNDGGKVFVNSTTCDEDALLGKSGRYHNTTYQRPKEIEIFQIQ